MAVVDAFNRFFFGSMVLTGGLAAVVIILIGSRGKARVVGVLGAAALLLFGILSIVDNLVYERMAAAVDDDTYSEVIVPVINFLFGILAVIGLVLIAIAVVAATKSGGAAGTPSVSPPRSSQEYGGWLTGPASAAPRQPGYPQPPNGPGVFDGQGPTHPLGPQRPPERPDGQSTAPQHRD